MQGDAELLASIFGGDPADNGPDPESEVQEPEPEVTESEDEVTEEPETEDIEGSQETEDQEQPTEDPQEEPEPERLYAGKYKTVEELDKAILSTVTGKNFTSIEEKEQFYRQAEKGFHNERQETSAIKRELDELRMMVTAKPLEQPRQPSREEIEAKREELRRRLQYEPETVIEEMAEERAMQIVDSRLSQVLGPVLPSIQKQAQSDYLNQQVQQYWRQHPDREQYKDAMSEVISNNPEIIRSPDWIDQAYLRAKIASLESKLLTPPVKPAKKVDPGKKKAAAVTVSSGAKSGTSESKTEDEKLREHIFGNSTKGKLVFDD